MMKDFIVLVGPLLVILIVWILVKVFKNVQLHKLFSEAVIVIFLVIQFGSYALFVEPGLLKDFILFTILTIIMAFLLIAGRNYLLITAILSLLLASISDILELTWLDGTAALLAYVIFGIIIALDITYEVIKEN